MARGGLRFGSPGGFSVDLLITISVTLPWLARKAGRVLRVVLLGLGTLALTATVFVWTRSLVAPLAVAGTGRLADLVTVLALVVAVIPGRAVLRTVVDRVVYRRRRRFWAELQAFLGTLSPEEGVAECCRRALAELTRALGLSGAAALLRFARREDFRFAPVDLGELVAATVATARRRLEEVHVAVEVDAAPVLVARADREKLRQVLLNLIENAVDALGAVAAPRRLRLAVAGTNGTATVSVTDNGPGVAPDALPQLFEPFFSLKEKGTGLGLAIARRTVEAHGGHIEAEVGSGAGLTIRVTLPATGSA